MCLARSSMKYNIVWSSLCEKETVNLFKSKASRKGWFISYLWTWCGPTKLERHKHLFPLGKIHKQQFCCDSKQKLNTTQHNSYQETFYLIHLNLVFQPLNFCEECHSIRDGFYIWQVLLYSHQELVKDVPIFVNYHLSNFVWTFHSGYQPGLQTTIETISVFAFIFSRISQEESKVSNLQSCSLLLVSQDVFFKIFQINFWVWQSGCVCSSLANLFTLATMTFLLLQIWRKEWESSLSFSHSINTMSHQSCSLTWEFSHAHQCGLHIALGDGTYCKTCIDICWNNPPVGHYSFMESWMLGSQYCVKIRK